MPFAPGRLEAQVVAGTVAFLRDCAERLAATVRPTDSLDFLDDENNAVPDGEVALVDES